MEFKLLKNLQKVKDDFITNRFKLSRASVREYYNVICCSTTPETEPEFDMVHTLTFAPEEVGVGDFPISLFRGYNENTGDSITLEGTVYWRSGTNGTWNELTVAPFDYDAYQVVTRIPITSETIQIAHSFNIDGDDVMWASFRGSDKVLTIQIENKPLPNVIGDNFMTSCVSGCTLLTSLGVPDTSNVTTVGDGFMSSYAYGCTLLTSLGVPDTSNVTTVGDYFMYNYASNSVSLISLQVPDTSNLTTVGGNFMGSYANSCTSLTSLQVPDTSNITTVGGNFMSYYAYGCSFLTSLVLPSVGYFATHDVNWGVLVGRLGVLKGKVINPSDLTAWQNLTVAGKTLYLNQIQTTGGVEVL